MLKTRRGITLIALVVTIIVLLILAGISINMLSGDNSILKNAGKSKIATEKAEKIETVKMAVLGAITNGKGAVKNDNLITELKNSIKELTDNDISGNEEDGWIVKTDNKRYSISNIGEVNEIFWEEIETDEGTEFRRIDGSVSGLKIGDIIGYSAIDGISAEDKNITSYGTVTGTGENNNQTIEIEAGTWRLLGIENGKLKIISNVVGRTPEANEQYAYASKVLTLDKEAGYANVENELNRICGLYGKGKYAEKGRSINIDDVNKITGYNPNAVGIRNPTAEQIANGTKFNQNSIFQYETENIYFWSGNVNKKPQFRNLNKIETLQTMTEAHNIFYWFDGNKWNESNYEEGKTGEICRIKSNYYFYYVNTLTESSSGNNVGISTDSPEYKVLFDKSYYGTGNRELYWLASKCVGCFSNAVFYYVYYTGGNSVGTAGLKRSNGDINKWSFGVRPIVYLKSDVSVKKDENGIWQFIEN